MKKVSIIISLFILLGCTSETEYNKRKNNEMIIDIIGTLTAQKMAAEIKIHKKIQYDLDSLRQNLDLKFGSKKIERKDFIRIKDGLIKELNIKMLMSL